MVKVTFWSETKVVRHSNDSCPAAFDPILLQELPCPNHSFYGTVTELNRELPTQEFWIFLRTMKAEY